MIILLDVNGHIDYKLMLSSLSGYGFCNNAAIQQEKTLYVSINHINLADIRYLDTIITILLAGSYSDDDLQDFIQESLKMKGLNHSHVMNLIGICLDAGPAPYIVMPFMGNGDLLSYLKKHREKLLVSTEVDNDEVYHPLCLKSFMQFSSFLSLR